MTNLSVPLPLPKRAHRLTTAHKDISKAALLIKKGGVVAFPFNGIWGLFGDIDNSAVSKMIYKAKNRPGDKKLIVVYPPEHLAEIVNLDRISFSLEKIEKLYRNLHALGVILPAKKRAIQSHLTIGTGKNRSVLNIHTEYGPLNLLYSELRKLGVRGLLGTSANKSGEPTHSDSDSLWKEFQSDVHAIVLDNFDNLPQQRKKSTSIIDLTEAKPRLHREGNVEITEIRKALSKYKFPNLFVGRDVITVRGR